MIIKLKTTNGYLYIPSENIVSINMYYTHARIVYRTSDVTFENQTIEITLNELDGIIREINIGNN